MEDLGTVTIGPLVNFIQADTATPAFFRGIMSWTRSKPPKRCNEYNVSRPSRFAAHCLRGQPVEVGSVRIAWWEFGGSSP
jgi:hypothetical protein